MTVSTAGSEASVPAAIADDDETGRRWDDGPVHGLVDEVASALDLAADEVESAIADVKAEIRAATDDERFQDLDTLRRQLEEMRKTAGELGGIRERWVHIRRDRYAADEVDEGAALGGKAEGGTKRYLGRVKRGTRTPEAAFRRPILEALVEMGGSGTVADVLGIVDQKIKHRLAAVDYEPLPSNPEAIRWRNTAQWTRNTLVEQGLLLRVRRRGTWEISDPGRQWLARRPSD